jgi:DNA replication ATP-dependent helicase Dna2
MSLFAEPFNAMKHREAQKSGIALKSNLPSRLRDLIIDLCEPRFALASSQSTIVELLCPRNISHDLFYRALLRLNAFYNGKYSHLIDGLNTTMGSDTCTGMQVTAFGAVLCGNVAIYNGCNPFELYLEYLKLNQGQRDALHKVMVAEDYTLILGLPGAGKTQTLSLITRIVIAKNYRILISSYTHAAVDNLMLKLRQAGVSSSIALRVGASTSIHADIRSYCIDRNDLNSASHPIANIDNKVNSARLIACTVLTAATSRLLCKFHPDWTIVDEAGQISQPAVIGALLKTKSFILVGDDYQLPPLVVSGEAQSQGMNISLFKRLSEAHPSSVVSLTAQYRMNQDIMTLCNELIYENRMSCGSSSVAMAKFLLPQSFAINYILLKLESSSHRTWIEKCLGSTQSVIFLNTDIALFKPDDNTIGTSLKAKSEALSMSNEYEKDIILLLIKCLIKSDYKLDDLGIISPYKSQVNLIQQAISEYVRAFHADMKSVAVPELDDRNAQCSISRLACEVSTVDKFQGRDMDMIIFSTVRSINDGSVSYYAYR